jgi:putative hydrolase of the HAD superfamily
MRTFDKWILSYEVGFKKPAIEIYQKAIEWASVGPKKILFIDDIKKYVDVAVSLGMQGIHFISSSQLKEGITQTIYCLTSRWRRWKKSG